MAAPIIRENARRGFDLRLDLGLDPEGGPRLQMRAMRRPAIAIVLVTLLLAGCDWSQRMEGRVLPDTVSLADHCATIMKAAMPFAAIDIGDRSSKGVDIRTITAEVSATRTDQSGNPNVDRDLAAECTFVDNVMTAFRWTKGGPPVH
jgi:hypothetical protein